MHTFFHGWRRKIGVTTLVVACVFAAGWVMSRSVRDGVLIGTFRNVTDSETIAAYIVIPYCCLAIPLTAFSAWLLLSKPAEST